MMTKVSKYNMLYASCRPPGTLARRVAAWVITLGVGCILLQLLAELQESRADTVSINNLLIEARADSVYLGNPNHPRGIWIGIDPEKHDKIGIRNSSTWKVEDWQTTVQTNTHTWTISLKLEPHLDTKNVIEPLNGNNDQIEIPLAKEPPKWTPWSDMRIEHPAPLEWFYAQSRTNTDGKIEIRVILNQRDTWTP